jgi:type VI secretion system secreted protein Hcp
MPFDSFIKIDGIPGESSDKSHPKSIEVSSFSWGESNSTTPRSSGGGMGTGKVSMQDFHFTMKTSTASPQLMLACANGQHIKEATLSVRKAGATQQDYLIVKLNDCLISSYSLGGASEDPDPVDEISLAFVKIDFVVRSQSETGGVE